jgi:hypothetical protein
MEEAKVLEEKKIDAFLYFFPSKSLGCQNSPTLHTKKDYKLFDIMVGAFRPDLKGKS